MKTSFLYIVILFTALSCGKVSHEKFNSENWKNSELNLEENWSLRWDMMNDLRNQYEIIGMNKTEVIKLLGNPESKTDTEFSYYLGYSKRGINTGNLTLTFDKNNKVTKIYVHQG